MLGVRIKPEMREILNSPNPIAYGGGGGGGRILSPTTIVLVATLVFTFLPQFEKILAKSIDQGVPTVIFQTRGHEKKETQKFFFL